MTAHRFTDHFLELIKVRTEDVSSLYEQLSQMEIIDERERQKYNPLPQCQIYKLYSISKFVSDPMMKNGHFFLESNKNQLMIVQMGFIAKKTWFKRPDFNGQWLYNGVEGAFTKRTDMTSDDQLYDQIIEGDPAIIRGDCFRFKHPPNSRFEIKVLLREFKGKYIVSVDISNPEAYLDNRKNHPTESSLSGKTAVQEEAGTLTKRKQNDLFEEGFPYLKIFYNQNGHAAVSISRYIMAGNSNDDQVIDLAAWLNKQRREELSDEQVARMESLGAYLDAWFDNCRRLAEFKKRNNHVEVPFEHVTDSGEKLGVWLHNQREAFRANKLSAEKAEILRKLGIPFLKKAPKAPQTPQNKLTY